MRGIPAREVAIQVILTMNDDEQPQSCSTPFQDYVEIIPDKLYWVTSEQPPSNLTHFNVDDRIRYIKYSKDFGPFSLAAIVNFCRVVSRHVFTDSEKPVSQSPVYFHSSTEPEKRANAALLISCFQLIVLKRIPEEIWERIRGPTILPFRDASYNEKCPYKCTILDCLQALQSATRLGWFSFDTFDIQQFELLEDLKTGNMSVIIPSKILACRGPVDQKDVSLPQVQSTSESKCLQVPSAYFLEKLKKLSASAVVRCNSTDEYDRQVVVSSGFDHFDMFFSDGSCPTLDIIQEFTKIVNEAKSYVAVHCKAGLGRTGTLIACYIMKQYSLSARQVIAWLRLCRSGSVLGKQQIFLQKYEEYLTACNTLRQSPKKNKQSLKDKENIRPLEGSNASNSSKTPSFITCCFNMFRRGKQSKQIHDLDSTTINQTAIQSGEESIEIKHSQDASGVFAQRVFFTEVQKQAERLLSMYDVNEQNRPKSAVKVSLK